MWISGASIKKHLESRSKQLGLVTRFLRSFDLGWFMQEPLIDKFTWCQEIGFTAELCESIRFDVTLMNYTSIIQSHNQV